MTETKKRTDTDLGAQLRAGVVLATLVLLTAAGTLQPGLARGQDHVGHEVPGGHDDHEHGDHDGETPAAPGPHGEGGDHEDHAEHAAEGGHGEGHAEHGDDGDHEGHADHAAEGDRDEGHAEHAGHGGHDDHGDEAIRLTAAELAEFGIEVAPAGPAALGFSVRLPGEIVPDADRLVHVVPPVAGVVRAVHVNLGDRVEAGAPIAELASRELAEARAIYLAAQARHALARTTFEREERLRGSEIASEADFLEVEQAAAEAAIELRSAEHQLHALGLRERDVAELDDGDVHDLTRLTLSAAMAGTVIERHAAVGEVVADDEQLFAIADLSTVWVDLSVFPRDLGKLAVGQSVRVRSADGAIDARGELFYVGRTLSEESRSALARVALANPEGGLHPGRFVTGEIVVDAAEVRVAVPRAAVIEVEGRRSVFVEEEPGRFEARPVELGRTDDRRHEVLRGLDPGERYVATGAFVLKSELQKGALAHAGHAH